MEVSIARMRDAIEMCNKLIPVMSNEEINQIGTILINVTNRIIKENEVIFE